MLSWQRINAQHLCCDGAYEKIGGLRTHSPLFQRECSATTHLYLDTPTMDSKPTHAIKAALCSRTLPQEIKVTLLNDIRPNWATILDAAFNPKLMPLARG